MQTFSYQSESIDREREVVVYLPPGYEGGSDQYPVLYLLHGAGGDEQTWVDRQQAPVILDNLIADGRLEPLGPQGGAQTTFTILPILSLQ